MLHHASTTLRRCPSVRHLSKLRLVDHIHLHRHTLQIHLLQWILITEHIINRNLWLSPRLLWSHWQVVALIHRELILALLVGVLDDLVHGYFVPNWGRGVGVLHVVEVHLAGRGVGLLHVVLTTSWGGASRIRVDAPYSLLLILVNRLLRRASLIRLCRQLVLVSNSFEISKRLPFRNINPTSFSLLIVFQTSLSPNRSQKRIWGSSLTHIDVIIVVWLLLGMSWLRLYNVGVHLVGSALRQVEVLLHIGTCHLRRWLALIFLM